MRRSVVILLLSGLLVAAGLLVATPASACSCAGGTTQEFFDGADAVFTARLVSREEPRGTITSSADPSLHVFAVETVFKGTAHRQQGVISPMSGASCGLELTGDGPFVVFATRSADLAGVRSPLADDQYAASLCGGTAPSTPAVEAELAALADTPPSAAPLPGAAGTVPPGPGLLGIGLLGIGAAGLLAGTWLLVARHRRSAR